MTSSEDIGVDIVLKKNDFYKVSLKIPPIQYQDIHPSNRQNISVFQSFQNRGKYQHTRYHYNAQTTTLVIEIHKKKFENQQKRTIIQFAEFLFKYWRWSISNMKEVLSKPLQLYGFKVESIDAIGFEFSRVFPEYSELQFNGNVVHVQFSKNLYPSIVHSFSKGNYYKTPRLLFLEESCFTCKLSDTLIYIVKNFTTGLTLYSLHMYPKILQNQTNKDKFIEVKQNRLQNDRLLQEVQIKRKELNRKVVPVTILTSSGKAMNSYVVQFQHQYKYTFSVSLSFNERRVHPLDKKQLQSLPKVVIRCNYYQQSNFKKLFERLEPYCGTISYKIDNTNKQIQILCQYKSRLAIQFLIISLEILWYKIIQRRGLTKRDTNKNQLNIEQLASNIIEVTYGNFYMRFLIKEDQTYQFDVIRTDFDRSKLQSLRSQVKYPTYLPTNSHQPGFLTQSQRTQDLKQIRKPLFDSYPGLKDYINFHLNNFGSKQYPELGKLCDICSVPDLSQDFKLLLNRMIDLINSQNNRPNQMIKLSVDKIQKQERQKKYIQINTLLKRYDTSGLLSSPKLTKLKIISQNQKIIKIQIYIMNNKPQEIRLEDLIRYGVFF